MKQQANFSNTERTTVSHKFFAEKVKGLKKKKIKLQRESNKQHIVGQINCILIKYCVLVRAKRNSFSSQRAEMRTKEFAKVIVDVEKIRRVESVKGPRYS